jgi:hypothetical protein
MFQPLSLRRAALALVLATSPALAQGVRIVDASGQLNFPDIQSAINAAVDGDVLLVGAGTYPGFTVNGKGISIFAAPPGASVTVQGTIAVSNVHGKNVIVVGLLAQPVSVSPYSAAPDALRVVGCSGMIAFQDCQFRAGPGPSLSAPYAAGCGVVQFSAPVVFAGCEFRGGSAGYWGAAPLPGGIGLRLSSSTIAAYASTFQGGNGSDSYNYAGPGGAGLRAEGSWVFASGCTFQGGNGGEGVNSTNPATSCGDGGNGLELDAGSEAHLLDNVYAGGSGGMNCWMYWGSPGLPISSQGVLDMLAGTARAFGLMTISPDRAPWSLSASGVPGDQAFLNRSLAPVFQFEPAFSGVCTSVLPPFTYAGPTAVLPVSGKATVKMRQGLLPDNLLARVSFLQGYVLEPGGATVLGNPMHTLSLNWNSLPDCNGNGIQDYAEVIAGITPDLDHDLIPDDCP